MVCFLVTAFVCSTRKHKYIFNAINAPLICMHRKLSIRLTITFSILMCNVDCLSVATKCVPKIPTENTLFFLNRLSGSNAPKQKKQNEEKMGKHERQLYLTCFMVIYVDS